MKRRTRSVALGAATALLFSVSATAASQDGYPGKPIRMLVGFSAGSATDATARLIAQKLSEGLGQPVIVDNRAGAAGAIATEMVVRAPADGYTLLMLGATEAILPALRTLPYDIRRDLSPISIVANGPQVLVVNLTVPARNVKELIALARQQPGRLHYGSAGVSSSSHLAGSLFNQLANVAIVPVPYKGATEMAVGTAANEVDMSFPSAAAALPMVAGGKVRALAVTSATRVSAMPSVPTLQESGLKGFDRSNWYGVLAPAGTPQPIVKRIHGLIEQAVNTEEMKVALNRRGLEPETTTPQAFAARIRRDITQNARLIKSTGAKGE
ncbi:MAG TPA: tripartite tricarboxylate transporter substrate binding protein [Burkholderiales bacterium]|nr:tripartite tricarboxylate transporter substrate binding protein [Burkholderiales bacterium]